MKKTHTLNLGSAICLVVLIYIIYRILLFDDILPFSIESVQTTINHWAKRWHIVAVGLLPIYVALVFFGALLFGIFFGSAAQRWICRLLQQK